VGNVDDAEEEGEGWGTLISPSDAAPARPGDLVANAGMWGAPEPIVGADLPTPLADEEPGGVVPPNPLWAMKDHRRGQWHLLGGRPEPVREAVGSGDGVLYVIDDGHHHAVLGRPVGASPSGCQYALVARVDRERATELIEGRAQPSEALDGAQDLTLCGIAAVADVLSANVFDVARYEDATEVPPPYRPGSPFVAFDDDLEITVY
jgi:hypothetical protein